MPEAQPCIVHEDDCPIEGWEDAARGGVQWRTLLSADRTPTAAMTLGVATLEPGGRGPTHLHRHAQPELYYVLSGEGVVAFDGGEHPIRPGSAVFISPDLEHGVRNTGAVPLRLLYVFAADSFDQIEYVFPERPDA